MPARDAQKYIAECIESILAQSYFNWELIVVDDGSTDQTAKIISDYSVSDDRIRLFCQPALGIIPALRLAYEQSSGSLITRMDSDDIMSSEKIEKLTDLLIQHGKGHVATGLVEYFSESGLGDGYRKYETWLNELTSTRKNYTEIYKECCIASPCWMLWREDLDACMAFRPDSYPEDYDLVFRFYENNLKVVAADDILHRWRDHDVRSSKTVGHYKENSFLDLKVNYFIKIDYKYQKNLVLWGAGKKAKKVARLLSARKIDFIWVCNNVQKIGQMIYETVLQDVKDFNFSDKQVIVTLANSLDKDDATQVLSTAMNCEYYFFC